jgi:hypothetical protein
MLRRIPKGVILLIEGGYDPGFKVLFGHVLDNVVTVGELINIPPVSVTDLAIDDFDFNGAFFHVDLAVLALGVEKHHLDAH